MTRFIKYLIVFLFLPIMVQANAIRLKDLVEFDGVRGNDLVGYGLVVGLDGTGDGLRNSPFTEEIMSNILERSRGQCDRRAIPSRKTLQLCL